MLVQFQFDNAEVYAHGKSERIMGQALAELDLPRSDLVISTKVFFGATPNPKPTAKGLSRKHIIEGVKGESFMGSGVVPHMD